jgi:predicted RNA binding protein YcfA (HicA-like mRNA interferase family)
MSKREKRLEKIRQNPKDVSFEALRQVLEDHGFRVKQVTGSHYTFARQIGNEALRLTIPYHRPVKQAYVMKAIAAIDKAIAQNQVNEDRPGNEDDDDNG